MHVNRRLAIWELCNEGGISIESCEAILTKDLGVRHIAKLVSWLLMPEPRKFLITTTTDLLQYTKTNAYFLKTLITGDELCLCGYDPETKAQSSVWKSAITKAKEGTQV